jgi:PAS domain S-box-containing protein
MNGQKSELCGARKHQTQIGESLPPLEVSLPQLPPEPDPAETSLQFAFDALAEPMWIMDANCRIQQCNRAAQDLFGGDIIGRPCWDVVHGLEEPALGCPYTASCQSFCRESVEVSLGSRWFKCTVDPLFGPPGKIAGAVTSLREISAEVAERRQGVEALERERRLLRTLINLLPDFIFVKDKQGRFLLVNEPLARSYARSPAEVLARTDADFMAPETAARSRATELKVMASQSVVACEDTLCFPDGKTRTMATNMAAFSDARGEVAGVVGIGHDITKRKLLERAAHDNEQKLHRANRTLQTIRDCHGAMLRAGTEVGLLEEICQVIVESGDAQMACVGLADRKSPPTLLPAAGYFAREVNQRAAKNWAGHFCGRGPLGIAVRTGRFYICRNTPRDRLSEPWRRFAARHGFGSAIALPLKWEGECIGALCISAADPNAFSSADQLLFLELADDLAFGLGTLRLRAERQRLEHENLEVTEREQERISRELHDGLCQLLVGAKLRSGCLKNLAKGRFPAAAREAKALEKLLNLAIEQTRDLAHGLNPAKITPAGLPSALRKLAENINSAGGPRCVCRCHSRAKITGQAVACHLYRIAQEAVQNALKHSRAKNISITLVRLGARLVLSIQDDGAGISPRRKKTGQGLANMETRARLIGGRLKIRPRRTGGTVVSCEVAQQPEKNS